MTKDPVQYIKNAPAWCFKANVTPITKVTLIFLMCHKYGFTGTMKQLAEDTKQSVSSAQLSVLRLIEADLVTKKYVDRNVWHIRLARGAAKRELERQAKVAELSAKRKKRRKSTHIAAQKNAEKLTTVQE